MVCRTVIGEVRHALNSRLDELVESAEGCAHYRQEPRTRACRKGARVNVVFDNTINLGHIISAVGFLVGGVSVFFALKSRLMVIEVLSAGQAKVIDAIQDEIKEMRKVVQEQARFDVKLATLERDLYDLKTGRGFIFDRPFVPSKD